MTAEEQQQQAILQALKAADEIAAALQAHLVEEHGANPIRPPARTLRPIR